MFLGCLPTAKQPRNIAHTASLPILIHILSRRCTCPKSEYNCQHRRATSEKAASHDATSRSFQQPLGHLWYYNDTDLQGGSAPLFQILGGLQPPSPHHPLFCCMVAVVKAVKTSNHFCYFVNWHVSVISTYRLTSTLCTSYNI